MLSDNLTIIPNSKLASSVVANYSLPHKEMAVLAQVGVSYNSDLKKVEKVTIEVAKEIMSEVSGGIPDFLNLLSDTILLLIQVLILP